MLLAFDSTDGPDGGCTTSLVAAVVKATRLSLLEQPRLVRLNPNVPWKTRGNGAVALRLGMPRGPGTAIGEWNGKPLLAFGQGFDAAPSLPSHEVVDAAWQVVNEESARHGAQPGLLAVAQAPNEAWYWRAVRTMVAPQDAVAAVRQLPDAMAHWTGDGRAMAGCLGALAWPAHRTTAELVAYREERNIGTRRAIDPGPLWPLDGLGVTFHTADAEEGRLACVPHTPCPVLAGLRGHDAARLVSEGLPALRDAAREPMAGWVLFRTNHASGDHVTPVETVATAQEAWTVAVDATVGRPPEGLPGGHALVSLHDRRSLSFDAIAFEPTRGLRAAVRALAPGDQVTVVGAWDAAMRTVRLEKLRVTTLAPRSRRVHNPVCCGKAMKSRGTAAGYRCMLCSRREKPGTATSVAVAPAAKLGWHEPTVMARRHLHRPAAWDDASRLLVTSPRTCPLSVSSS